MFVTGAVWIVVDWQKSISDKEYWQTSAAWLLMLHGGLAMAILRLLCSCLRLLDLGTQLR